ncbi:MAG: ABC transporter permease, partial [Oscillospiraceae bacterium]|nr:ABC transporter permease [Oscillospiraceae bacterium]
MENNRQKQWKTAVNKLLRNKLAVICFAVLIAEIILVLLAGVIAPYSPESVDASIKLAPGFWAQWSNDPVEAAKYVPGHVFGTDHLGRDVLSRLLYGGRISLAVGFCSTAMGLFFGVILGMLAGYYPKLDNIIMRFMDLLFTFPGTLLAMLIMAMLGASTFNAMLAISIWSIPSFARMIRGKVLQIKQEDYIMAVKSLGAS